MLFISHANPEDNEFTLWLALHLAKQGFPVWCDLTKLIGGEDFWVDIEQAIRNKTVKFIYVLSKTSNGKIGPLQELQVATNVMRDDDLQDFMIPLLIDDLPHHQINIQLNRLNAISFRDGWARGLKNLLEKLEQDNVQKSPNFSPDAVAAWWRNEYSAEGGIRAEKEEYLSNWFAIDALPDAIYFHTLRDSRIGELKAPANLPYPAFLHNIYLVSFAPAKDFDGRLGSVSIVEENIFTTEGLLDGRVGKKYIQREQKRDPVYRLLRLAWESFARERKLRLYQMSQDVNAFYFPAGLVEDNTVYFQGIDVRQSHRSMVGYSTIKGHDGRPDTKRIWHFAIQAKPLVYPTAAYVIKSHIVFSDDGQQIWESAQRLHRARRSFARNWWNPQWRDRILAAMSWLAGDQEKITLGLGSNASIQVSKYPLRFTSPVSYTEPVKASTIKQDDEEEREADTHEDELDESEDEEAGEIDE